MPNPIATERRDACGGLQSRDLLRLWVAGNGWMCKQFALLVPVVKCEFKTSSDLPRTSRKLPDEPKYRDWDE